MDPRYTRLGRADEVPFVEEIQFGFVPVVEYHARHTALDPLPLSYRAHTWYATLVSSEPTVIVLPPEASTSNPPIEVKFK